MRPSHLISAVGIAIAGYLTIQGCGKSIDDNCENKRNCDGDGGGGGSLFVSQTSGNDSASAGTQENPLKTINAALARNPSRVSICEGNYAEQVKVTSAVEIVGGFDCGTWVAGNKATTIAPTSGIPLTIRASHVAVSNLSVIAAPGTAQDRSSITAFVSESQGVTLSGVTLTAQAGARGADGALSPATNPDLNGYDADSGVPGPPRTCVCPAGGSSTGGTGGGTNESGGSGSSTPPTGRDGGAGGIPGDCVGGVGRAGADAPGGLNGTSAQVPGTLAATGWTAAGGSDGKPGGPGQGGGGGGGTTSGTGLGGGGGCGSCGGAAGTGGSGGGSSIALLSFSSDVTLAGCKLDAARAGDGGKGAPGQPVSAESGFGGNGFRGGCAGGRGGRGGVGGAGAGGAAGMSVGVAFQGAAPKLDAATQSNISVKEKGARGVGGAAADCSSPVSNCGADGRSEKLLDIASP